MICRIEAHKRQWLLVEAMRHVQTDVKLRLCGTSMSSAELDRIRNAIAEYQLESKVIFEDRWISEQEKIERLATALAVAYLPEDEDSYGYCSLEAAHARKAVLTTTDSGGVLELIDDGINGLIVPPDARALAEAMDSLFLNRAKSERMGSANQRRLSQLGINWATVINMLTS
jgi:glycosyltransferase involved in cell wall biosynthesis